MRGLRILTGEQMRTADREAIDIWRIPSRVLMENAGRGVVEGIQHVVEHWQDKVFIIACGRGNNGGDGLVVARHLRQRDVAQVYPIILGARERLSEDMSWNLELYEKNYGGVPNIQTLNEWVDWSQRMGEPDVLIDAVLGTGLKAPLEGFLAEWVEMVNRYRKTLRVAVDIPTGLDADRSEFIGPAIKAHYTFTMGGLKPCLVFPPACIEAGKCYVVTIGTPEEVLKKYGNLVWPSVREMLSWLPPRPVLSHKGMFGRILIIAGSAGRLGAAAMAARSALRIGAGLVTLVVPHGCWSSVMSMADEIMTLGVKDEEGFFCPESLFDIEKELANSDVVILGPGIGTKDSVVDFVENFLEVWSGPLVVDADGLNCLAQRPRNIERFSEDTVLTPHPGEMARLVETSTTRVLEERVKIAQEFVESFPVTLVLKGYRTLIVHPSGLTVVNPTGGPALATAGMGDILSGFIGGLWGQVGDGFRAAVLGVYLHGLAGDIAAQKLGEPFVVAQDLLKTIHDAWVLFRESVHEPWRL